MSKRRTLKAALRGGGLGALTASLVILSAGVLSKNIVPDAVTRATRTNVHEGEVSVLTDGRYPGSGSDAEAFRWPGKGTLVIEWDEPLPLLEVRMFVGDLAGLYVVKAYLGGKLDETGTTRWPEGTLVAQVTDNRFITNGWAVLPFPPDTVVDNLELWVSGGAEFFEVEVIVQVEASVRPMTWGKVKALHRW